MEIFDIAFAADGTPWVATTGGMHYPGGSLSYHDGGQWHDVTGDQALNSFTSVALGPGDIVAASTQLGLALYDGSRRHTSQEWHLLRDGPTSDKVTSVAVTPDGAAWFAFGDHSASTAGWGLSRFDGQQWDYFLDDAEVNALAVGPDGTLWAGVGCGVQRFDGAAWEIVARCGGSAGRERPGHRLCARRRGLGSQWLWPGPLRWPGRGRPTKGWSMPWRLRPTAQSG